MKIDFFRYLPPEIIIDILSRLPVRTIVFCKLVRKSSRDLLRTREFADSHLCKSASGIVTSGCSRYLKIFEFIDEIDLEHHNRHYIPVTELDTEKVTGLSALQGSANGFLFLLSTIPEPDAIYICNPVTREYIQPPNDGVFCSLSTFKTYGFGVSKMTAQYKVVRIVHECIRDPDTLELLGVKKCICHVFTLGTGKWRSIAPCAPTAIKLYAIGAFINGGLHWLATDLQGSNWISCFDLETEIFSTFSAPPLSSRDIYDGWWLVAFGDYLCMCDGTSDDEIVIWLMKEYGDERSWTKEFVIKKNRELVRDDSQYLNTFSPIRVFKNGEILIAWYGSHMFYYSNETKTTQKIDMLGAYEHGCGFTAMLHTSSFLSLKSCFPMENVRPFRCLSISDM